MKSTLRIKKINGIEYGMKIFLITIKKRNRFAIDPNMLVET